MSGTRDSSSSVPGRTAAAIAGGAAAARSRKGPIRFPPVPREVLPAGPLVLPPPPPPRANRDLRRLLSVPPSLFGVDGLPAIPALALPAAAAFAPPAAAPDSERAADGRWPCTVHGCTKSFSTKGNREQHVNRVHANCKCTVGGCGLTFLTRVQLKQHVRSTHDPKRFKCSFPGCGSDFSSRSHLLTHIGSAHEKRRYTCWLPKVVRNPADFLRQGGVWPTHAPAQVSPVVKRAARARPSRSSSSSSSSSSSLSTFSSSSSLSSSLSSSGPGSRLAGTKSSRVLQSHSGSSKVRPSLAEEATPAAIATAAAAGIAEDIAAAAKMLSDHSSFSSSSGGGPSFAATSRAAAAAAAATGVAYQHPRIPNRCGKSYEDPSHLRNHMRRIHNYTLTASDLRAATEITETDPDALELAELATYDAMRRPVARAGSENRNTGADQSDAYHADEGSDGLGLGNQAASGAGADRRSSGSAEDDVGSAGAGGGGDSSNDGLGLSLLGGAGASVDDSSQSSFKSAPSAPLTRLSSASLATRQTPLEASLFGSTSSPLTPLPAGMFVTAAAAAAAATAAADTAATIAELEADSRPSESALPRDLRALANFDNGTDPLLSSPSANGLMASYPSISDSSLFYSPFSESYDDCILPSSKRQRMASDATSSGGGGRNRSKKTKNKKSSRSLAWLTGAVRGVSSKGRKRKPSSKIKSL